MTIANAQLQGMIELFESLRDGNAEQAENWKNMDVMAAYFDGKHDAYDVVVERLEAAVRAMRGDA